MMNAANERELVRVPIRRLPNRERKAQELDTPLPIAPQKIWEIPRRWREY
jgi:hypothetical protein